MAYSFVSKGLWIKTAKGQGYKAGGMTTLIGEQSEVVALGPEGI